MARRFQNSWRIFNRTKNEFRPQLSECAVPSFLRGRLRTTSVGTHAHGRKGTTIAVSNANEAMSSKTDGCGHR